MPSAVMPVSMHIPQVQHRFRYRYREPYPYVTATAVAPANWPAIRYFLRIRPEVCLLDFVRTDPTQYVAHIGCRDRRVRDVVDWLLARQPPYLLPSLYP